MKYGSKFKILSLFLVATYLLSACGGTLPKSSTSEAAQNQSGAPKEVVFAGVVESINGNQWVVNGQRFTVDSHAALDPNIAVGATVTIDATVAQDGSVVAQRVRSSNQTSDDSNSSNDNSSNSNSNQNDNSNANANDNNNGNSNGNTNDNTNGNDSTTEVSGVVQAITADSITVDGVVYNLADFSEFKDTIAVGDQVQLEVIVNPDGTFTILEVGKPDSISNDNSNGNSNDGSVGENGNSNSNSDDDHGGNSNSNDGGDDSGSDDSGNSNGD